MTKKNKHLVKLLDVQNEHKEMMHKIVVESIKEEEELIIKLQKD
jgi:hypothetical protein